MAPSGSHPGVIFKDVLMLLHEALQFQLYKGRENGDEYGLWIASDIQRVFKRNSM